MKAGRLHIEHSLQRCHFVQSGLTAHSSLWARRDSLLPGAKNPSGYAYSEVPCWHRRWATVRIQVKNTLSQWKIPDKLEKRGARQSAVLAPEEIEASISVTLATY